jgi:hypothetical protein
MAKKIRKNDVDELLVASPEQMAIFESFNVSLDSQQTLLRTMRELVGNRPEIERRAANVGIASNMSSAMSDVELLNMVLGKHLQRVQRMLKALNRLLSIGSQLQSICKAAALHNNEEKATLLSQEQCDACGVFTSETIAVHPLRRLCADCSKMEQSKNS